MKKRKNFKRLFFTSVVIALVVILVLIFTGCSTMISVMKSVGNKAFRAQASEQAESARQENQQQEQTQVRETGSEDSAELQQELESDIPVLSAFDNAVSTIAARVKPSVVNIKVTVQQEDIFGNMQTGEGVGSGIVFSNDGYIITNNHVAGNALELKVTTYEGKEYTAKLVGTDKNTDVAVIKIDEKNLIPANFATIENIKVGQLAIAIGSPFGLQESVTVGVVSAVGRDLSYSYESMPLVDLIQTDAAINPGNSGGALVNSAGQVIGVNTIIYSTSGSNAGIGFAIPSDMAVNIANQIIKYGKAKIPFIGIEMGNSTTEIKGILVKSVIKGMPAESAGIEPGDIITEFDGKAVEDPYELFAQILKHNVGDNVELKVNRDNNVITVNLTLAENTSQQVN